MEILGIVLVIAVIAIVLYIYSSVKRQAMIKRLVEEGAKEYGGDEYVDIPSNREELIREINENRERETVSAEMLLKALLKITRDNNEYLSNMNRILNFFYVLTVIYLICTAVCVLVGLFIIFA